ncbi:asparaginase [Candidatus Woesearchaeota archaeon]|nr:asparaginase [Candidatus Woesearchaeota archaeon]
MKPEYGDAVKIHTDEQTYEGILMPRPEIFEKDHTIIKLDNGYNIGIDNNKIRKIDVVRKYQPKKEEKIKLHYKKGLPTVSILSFGGTISSRVDYKTGGVYADYTAEDFVEMLPELKNAANLKAEKVMGIMSEDMSPQEWSLMAKHIAKELNDNEVNGVVVTQGTDTLHFSTAAMSFFLRNLNKPVIFTAALL